MHVLFLLYASRLQIFTVPTCNQNGYVVMYIARQNLLRGPGLKMKSYHLIDQCQLPVLPAPFYQTILIKWQNHAGQAL